MSHVLPAGADAHEDGQPRDGRSARKRQAIIDAATALFLEQGYQGTSMDDIAAMAAVSKQTVYKNFADKQQLFSVITLGAAARADVFIRAVPTVLAGTGDLEASLRALARQYLATVMQPGLLRLRRLIVGEAGRFPDLARAYYQRVPERVLAALATQMGALADRGLLRIEDPLIAAGHYAFLVLGLPLDRAMFLGLPPDLSSAELDRQADAAVDVFLAAYGPR
jgi:TetR/AcrR family transcriptional repressor of mexJK operon